jgi:hypothetical protein
MPTPLRSLVEPETTAVSAAEEKRGSIRDLASADHALAASTAVDAIRAEWRAP